MIILGTLKDINSLNKKTQVDSILQNNIRSLRNRTKIFVIDDNEFSAAEKLRRNGYNITPTTNIPNIEATKDYPIVLCDLKGVGLDFSNNGEGAHLIKSIKTLFPSKIVIAYTAGASDELIEKAKNFSDGFLKKSADISEWSDILDEKIKDVTNPVFTWKKIRIKLLENQVTPLELAKLEHSYVESIEKRTYKILEKEANKSTNLIGKSIISLIIDTLKIWNELNG